MRLGDASACEQTEGSQLVLALNTLHNALSGLIDTIEAGGLDQLTAAQKSASGSGSKPSGTGCR
jgi:mevalonate kinase